MNLKLMICVSAISSFVVTPASAWDNSRNDRGYQTTDSFGNYVNSNDSYQTRDSFGNYVNSNDRYQTRDSFGIL